MTVPPTVDAQASGSGETPLDVREVARTSYAEGQSHYAAGEFEQAEAAFIRAYQAVPSPVVLIGIAEARFARGLGPEAIQIYERYLRVAPNAPDAQAVRDRIAALHAMPGHVRILTSPEGAEIYLDGHRTGLLTPANIEVTPGVHEIEVRLVGHGELHGTVDVPIASTRTIDGHLEPVAESAFVEPTVAEEPVAPPEPEPTFEGERRELETTPLVWSLAATTAGVAIGGAIAGFEALSHDNELRPPSDGSTFVPDPAVRRTRDREVLASHILLGASAGLAAATVVTFFVQNRSDDDAPRVTVVPCAQRGIAGIVVGGRF